MLWDWPGLTGLPEIRQGRQHPESLPCPGRTNPAIVSNVRMTDIRMEIGITNLNLSWISWIPQWLGDLKLQNPMVHELITPWPSKPPEGSRCGYLFNISVPVVEWNSLWLGNSILSSNWLCMANREWITIASNPQNHEAKTTFPNCEERPAAPETLTGKSRSSSGYVASLQCLFVALSVQGLLKVGGVHQNWNFVRRRISSYHTKIAMDDGSAVCSCSAVQDQLGAALRSLGFPTSQLMPQIPPQHQLTKETTCPFLLFDRHEDCTKRTNHSRITWMFGHLWLEGATESVEHATSRHFSSKLQERTFRFWYSSVQRLVQSLN